MIFSEKIKNCKINGKKCRIKNGENLIFDENLDFTLDSGGNSFTIKITPQNPNNYNPYSGKKIDPEILLDTVRIPAKFRNKPANIAYYMTDSDFLYINCLFFEEGVTKTAVANNFLNKTKIKIVYVPSTKTDGTGAVKACFYCNFSEGEKQKPSNTGLSFAYNKEIRFSDNIILSCDKNDNTVSIAGYDKFIFDSEIKLPNYFYYNSDNRHLCGFNDYSFADNTYYSDMFDKSCLKKITLTSGYDTELKKIGKYSFYGNELLETVPFSYITEIGNYAFKSTAVTTGSNNSFGKKSGITSIGIGAFSYSKGAILNFYVNNECKIYSEAFKNGSQTSIGFSTKNNKCITLGSSAFLGNGMETFYADSSSVADTYGYCYAIKDLSDNAFDGCANLYGGESYSDLYFNTNTKVIPSRCFYRCKNLHNIHLEGGNVQLYSSAIYDTGFNGFKRSNTNYSRQINVHADSNYRVSEKDKDTSYGCSSSAYSAKKASTTVNVFQVNYL